MEIELGHALAPEAVPGVSRDSLERLDVAVERIHDRIERGIDAGQFGYAAVNLGRSTDPDTIRAVVGDLPTDGPVIVIGMGGSALGARAMAGALAPHRETYILDTIDPTYLERMLEVIDLDRAVCHVVSQSGETVETLATFRIVRQAMIDAGVEWESRTIATTPTDGSLWQSIDSPDVARIDPPTSVPGRYSVLSSMALPSAVLLGIDIEALLAGGRRARDALHPSLFKSPAYAYGATMAALSMRGVSQNAFVPYAEDLDGLAAWFCQLWAESLGKDGVGQTPIHGRGIADHHAHLQRWRAGPRDLAVTTLQVDHPSTLAIPGDGHLGDFSAAELHDLERRAAVASLAVGGRPTVDLVMEGMTPSALGETFVTLQAACITFGELMGIDPFTQPAVDWRKRAVRDALEGRTTNRTDRLDEAPVLRID